MLQSSLFWNKLDVSLQSQININTFDKNKNDKQAQSLLIEEDEGRGGHAIFYHNGEFLVIGGEDNTFLNWMQLKENARKS